MCPRSFVFIPRPPNLYILELYVSNWTTDSHSHSSEMYICLFPTKVAVFEQWSVKLSALPSSSLWCFAHFYTHKSSLCKTGLLKGSLEDCSRISRNSLDVVGFLLHGKQCDLATVAYFVLSNVQVLFSLFLVFCTVCFICIFTFHLFLFMQPPLPT